MSVPAFAPTRPQWFPANRAAACAGLALALVSLAAVPRASAQDPAQRSQLESFRDSVGGTVDSVGLLALEKRMIEQTKANRSDAMMHLRLGFLSLRLGELGGQSHYEDAASEFQWAIDLQPTWPYSWYGMGFAEYGVGDSQISFVTGIKTMLGKDALTRSAMAFAKSAEVDPSFDQGLVDLANTALRQRVNIKLGVALEALRRAASTPAATHPDVMLARGRVEREVGDGDSALVAFQGYVANGPNKSLGQLEVARTLFLLGRFDGVAPYFEGAASDDSVTVAAYRSDLAAIAGDSIMGEFNRTSGARRAEYLKNSGASATTSSCGPKASACASTIAASSTPARTSSSPPSTATTTSSSATGAGAATSTTAASSTSATASPAAAPAMPRPGSSPTSRGATAGPTAT